MIRTVLKKALVALLAIWGAWSLGTLAKEIRLAAEEHRLLQQEIHRITQELSQPEPGENISDQLKAMGYVYRGDIVFFDGGQVSYGQEAQK